MPPKNGEIKQFEDIELSGRVIVSDPCYNRDVWCRGELDIIPGVYETFLEYGDEGRVAKLRVRRKASVGAVSTECASFEVGVDSGQAGIFCDTIYPTGTSTGEYQKPGTFYGDVCELTLGEGYRDEQRRWNAEGDLNEISQRRALRKDTPVDSVLEELDRMREEKAKTLLAKPEVPWYQGGTYQGKGLVSCSGYGDGGYRCLVGKDEYGNTSFLEIVFIDEEDENRDCCNCCGNCGG